MSKYICQICGYVYDEETQKVKFDDLPDDWVCPLCGAPKEQFKQAEAQEQKPVQKSSTKSADSEADTPHDDVLRPMTDGELAAVFSNLARGCEKQYKAEESALFTEIAAFFTAKAGVPSKASFDSLAEKIAENLDNEFVVAKNAAEAASDRGAKRVLTWSEKVTRMTSSILAKYKKEGDAMLENTKIWVCDICGFIYIGDVPPSICPICKVPSFKILEVARA